ncbi:MAG: HypC/HybG/HupF family hydrogenase formation chaperone [Candidatus Omnitrophota bacterium]
MCLGIPMKILTKDKDSAVVSSGGTRREISVGLIRNAGVGDYVIVHAGFAIEKLDEKRAKETLDILRQIKP